MEILNITQIDSDNHYRVDFEDEGERYHTSLAVFPCTREKEDKTKWFALPWNPDTGKCNPVSPIGTPAAVEGDTVDEALRNCAIQRSNNGRKPKSRRNTIRPALRTRRGVSSTIAGCSPLRPKSAHVEARTRMSIGSATCGCTANGMDGSMPATSTRASTRTRILKCKPKGRNASTVEASASQDHTQTEPVGPAAPPRGQRGGLSPPVPSGLPTRAKAKPWNQTGRARRGPEATDAHVQRSSLSRSHPSDFLLDRSADAE